MAFFRTPNPFIYNPVRESVVPILITLALMNLYSSYIYYPQKTLSQVVAPPLCKSQMYVPYSWLHSNSHINWLAWTTSHVVHYKTTSKPPAPSIFFLNIKVGKLFEDPSYKRMTVI
jgi:hypothetical protein